MEPAALLDFVSVLPTRYNIVLKSTLPANLPADSSAALSAARGSPCLAAAVHGGENSETPLCFAPMVLEPVGPHWAPSTDQQACSLQPGCP